MEPRFKWTPRRIALSVIQWALLFPLGYLLGRGRQYGHESSLKLAAALSLATGAIGLIAALGMRLFGYDFGPIAGRRGSRLGGVLLEGVVVTAVAVFVWTIAQGRDG